MFQPDVFDGPHFCDGFYNYMNANRGRHSILPIGGRGGLCAEGLQDAHFSKSPYKTKPHFLPT